MKRKITMQGILIIAAAALLGITGTTVGVMALMGTQSPAAVTVEDFVGKTKKVVEKWRTEHSIPTSQVVYKYEYDEEKEKDTVLKQNMQPKASFTSTSTLRITLSNGADPDVEFELPDFTDQNEKDVKAWFTDNKFTSVIYKYEVNESVTPGNFISMDKEAGTKVKRSESITVTICTPLEAEEVTVPALASMNKNEIIAWANENRINLSFIERANDTIAEGNIISISVSEGQRLNAGDTVTVEISTGPADQEESRYNAEQKDNTQKNVTPPSNDNVSGGNPSGTTTPSDNSGIGDINPPENSKPSGGDNTNSSEESSGGSEPVVEYVQIPSGISAEDCEGSTREEIKDYISYYFSNVDVQLSFVEIESDKNALGGVSPGPGNMVAKGSVVTVTIYYIK